MLKYKFIKYIISGIFVILYCSLVAQTPVVKNVRFEQRTDGSLLVDIWYDVTSVSNLSLEIFVEASDDGGITWDLPCNSLSGNVGQDITAGKDKHVIWNFFADNPDTSGVDYQVRVTAHCMVCGETITEDFTFTRDINCPDSAGAAMIIGAPDVLIDLGGFTLTGDLSHGFHEGIIADHVGNVTIQNGTIKNFLNSIILGSSDNSTVKNISIINLLSDDPTIHASGVIVGGSKGIVIRDCWFEFLPEAHKGAINAANSEILVDNIQMTGGSIGVGIGGLIEPGNVPSRGSIINSKFNGPAIGGAHIGYVDSLLVANNEFENSCISVVPPKKGNVTGMVIKENTINNFPGYAIYLRGGDESVISNNNITNCGKGIVLEPSKGCGPDTLFEDLDCNFPTGNLITQNTLTNNQLDLSHCDKCLGNTWLNNTYETAQGSEIYNYGPSTAKDGLATVDSVATSLFPDAQLLHVASGNIDTLGKAIQWNYFYKSASQNNYYEFWYQDGRVINRGIFSESWLDDFLPVTESWINSDSALIITDSMGGKEFREKYDVETIEMGLQKSYWFFWTVNYIAQDTAFQAVFDATRD